jgi:predicted nucleotide-binding protein
MQVCEKGHVITVYGVSRPTSLMKHCSKCGSATMTECPQCRTTIPGYTHIAGFGYLHTSGPPAHCNNCGEAFPWKELLELRQAATSEAVSTNRIFIVHGHDSEMKEAVARTLSLLGLQPIILHEQVTEGNTIIEKFEKHADAGFAVVLLSPDDMAYSKAAGPRSAKPRARQNVILELGYFAAKLTRSGVFCLYRDSSNLELPSDIAGVVYNIYDKAGRWQFELVKELKAAGYDVDANKII